MKAQNPQQLHQVTKVHSVRTCLQRLYMYNISIIRSYQVSLGGQHVEFSISRAGFESRASCDVVTHQPVVALDCLYPVAGAVICSAKQLRSYLLTYFIMRYINQLIIIKLTNGDWSYCLVLISSTTLNREQLLMLWVHPHSCR